MIKGIKLNGITWLLAGFIITLIPITTTSCNTYNYNEKAALKGTPRSSNINQNYKIRYKPRKNLSVPKGY